MSNPELTPMVADEVPWSDGITDYDEAHAVVYLRLLDAKAAGADADEMARLVLGIDPLKEPEHARNALASHIRRAEWMTEKGYRQVLGQ